MKKINLKSILKKTFKKKKKIKKETSKKKVNKTEKKLKKNKLPKIKRKIIKETKDEKKTKLKITSYIQNMELVKSFLLVQKKLEGSMYNVMILNLKKTKQSDCYL